MNDTTLVDCTLIHVSPEELSSLLIFCLNATYFTFTGGFYKQILGTTIESPIFVVAANLVIEEVEQKALNLLSRKVPDWKIYNDNTFTIVQHDMLINLHNHKYSSQWKMRRMESYLSSMLTVTRDKNGDMSTSVYTKVTHTGHYLHFRFIKLEQLTLCCLQC